ncbi:PKD domain-containing protein [Pyxidicoccus parkwayensis]|uniref:PKD domain-containing protein n=1 Tax=Pyxidicoccus parkwayensis TaxID=2813578 RepID=A0ABX7P2A3_9BACT|nr:PKD domain-containing protein [Pyxidicoccus parkwaysis]QSQ24682.1 PKD domain-containing protein [Pyxidicoccus parkwaysis]
MKPLLRARLAVVLVAAGLWACDTTPGPLRPPPNTAPVLRILRPDAASALRVGQPVEFEATVEDAEDGDSLGDRVLWVSSREGQLARGRFATTTFREEGQATLTATVVDSGGQVTSASLPLNVLGPGAPVATVMRPTAGSAFNLGEPLDLECQAVTVGGERLTGGAVQWTSALTGPLPSGETAHTSLRVAGEDTLTCTATDPATGASTTATVRVTVRATRAPSVLITRPEQEEVYVKTGEPVPFASTLLFRATAQDFNADSGAGNLDGAIRWVLEPGGVELGTGPSVEHTFTEPGEYTVTARVVDGLGNTATDGVRIQLVTNLPPWCEIEIPLGGARLLRGAASTLHGHCMDPETGAALPPVWATSAASTPLGTGETVEAVLTVAGAQTLSACAVDPEDATLRGCAERPVRVIDNSAPTGCAIQAPRPATTAYAGRELALTGSATDAEDPQGDLRFEWTSSRDGLLGRGASVTTNRLTAPGEHVLTLTVRDPWGLACTASVTVTVNGAPEVRVATLLQGSTNCLEAPCREGQAIVATGALKGVDSPGSLTRVAWLDSLGNDMEVGASASPVATLTAPGVGRHTLVLLAETGNGAVGRAAASFTVLSAEHPRLLDVVSRPDEPAVALARLGDSLRFVNGEAASVFSMQPSVGTLSVGAPARALDSLRTSDGDVLFVGTDGGGVHRCVEGTCTRFMGGPLSAGADRVTAVAAMEAPDLLVLGTPRGLVLTRASNPSLGGRAGTIVGQRLLEGREVRQVAVSPLSTRTHVKIWAATSAGLAELTVQADDDDFEPALAEVTVALHVPPEVPDTDVLSVAVGPERQVFAGTRRGFSALGRPGPALRAAPWSLEDEQVSALLFERRTTGSGTRDVLWAGTKAGLVRYDVASDIVTRFGTNEGLPSPDVRALLMTPDGVRYIATPKGVARYAAP